ncbi:MAG: Exoglucanase B precursor [Syntrophorhabdus sp. PtaU1.Bin002]|nr:MAG: Exoglucanase B precursor [Syntrophorhabdus sp. PtaB.Bin006]OPY69775.1 MAG: Exoglucanase B precursor [Syntrophorhabdus sp. PtaU1.Bin002]
MRLRDRSLAKSLTFALSLGILCLIISCGKKGNPVPKSLPVPGGINDLSGEVKDGVLFLSFTMPTKNKDGSDIVDLGGFRIMKSCSSCNAAFGTLKEIRLDDTRGFTIQGNRLYMYDDDLAAGYQYAYRAHPVTKKGAAGDASNVFLIRWEEPPPKPAGPISAKVNDGGVELSWPQDEGYSYSVYRHDENVYPLFPTNKELLTKPFFVDTGLINGQKYLYEIRKVKEKAGVRWEGEGLKVEAIPRDLTPPSVPRNVKAEKRGGAARVSWTAGEDKDLAGYHVYRLVAGKAQRLTKIPVQGTFYADHDIAPYRYLSYYVTSIDLSGNESEPSTESVVVLKE